MSTLDTFEQVFNGLTDVADVGEMLGGSVPVIGSVVHGGEALAHGGAALYDECTGDHEGAKEQTASAAVNAVEAIPFVGTGVSIADGITEYANSQDGMGDLKGMVKDWMFGEKTPDVAPSNIPPEQPGYNVEQAAADKKAIEDAQMQSNAEKVSQREAEFEASGQSPAQHREFAQQWDQDHGVH